MYVREMKALGLAADGAAPATEGDLEAGGFVLTGQTIEDLGRVDVLRSAPRCRRALVLARDDLAPETRLLDHLTALGIDASQSVQPGYADMVTMPHHNKVPHEAIACAVDWLRAGAAEERTAKTWQEGDWSTQASMASPPPGIRERILHIGGQAELFGIVSEPCGPVEQAASLLVKKPQAGSLCYGEPAGEPLATPFVVLLNSGSTCRVGPSRLYVELARDLAGRGFRSLRLDLCGLGDSVSPDAGAENDPYPATAFRDVHLTLEHLRGQLGVERVVLMGLCSGAYAAFQSAARLPGSVLVESVLINPLTFYWREGMSLDISPGEQLHVLRRSLASLLHPGKWLRFLFRRGPAGIRLVLKALVESVRLRLGRWSKAIGPCCPGTPAVPLAHPAEEDLAGDLERIVGAGRHLACFFARGDPGHGLLTFLARRKVDELCRTGRMDVQLIDDADHTFTRREARRALVRAIGEHLARRHGRGSGAHD
jgi:pimeloyl-ACP methyl ester carboxylesterase